MLQGSSKLTQIPGLSVSNNNTTESDKAIHSYILSNNSENDSNPLLMVEEENIKNTTVNKIESTSFHNYRPTLQIDNLSVEPTNNDLPLFNNLHNDDSVNSAHSSAIMEDDQKTTEAIMSLAMTIQTNFNFVDDFESDDINVSNICATNEIQTTKCLIEQNGYQNTDPLKLEEEYKMHNSLKLLESLVNIEHDKLEVQKSLTENEIQPTIETNETTRFKSSKKTNIMKKKSRKSHKNTLKEEEKEEEWLPSSNKRNRCSKNKTKPNKIKTCIDKTSKKNKKMEVQNTLNNVSTSNSSCSTKIQNDESISLALNGSLFSSYTKKPETIVSTTKTTKSLDTSSSVETQVENHNTKDCLQKNEFNQLSNSFESMLYNEKNNVLAVAGNNSNAVLIKTSHVASTSGYNDKDVGNIKNKSSCLLSPVMKTSDYKKLYEKDRKSLFSPDVVIIKNAPVKLLKDDLPIKKEYNLLQVKEDQDKKSKSKTNKKEIDTKTSDKKRKISTPEVKATKTNPKTKRDSKSKPNNASTSLEQKSSYVKRSNNKSKRLKVSKPDGEAKTIAVSSTNNGSNTTDKLNNKVSNNIDALNLQKLNSLNSLRNNKYGEGSSRHQQLNGVNVLDNKESIKKEEEPMPEWMRKKCEMYNIKPLYVVINPFITY